MHFQNENASGARRISSVTGRASAVCRLLPATAAAFVSPSDLKGLHSSLCSSRYGKAVGTERLTAQDSIAAEEYSNYDTASWQRNKVLKRSRMCRRGGSVDRQPL